jgi:hypothetical protein
VRRRRFGYTIASFGSFAWIFQGKSSFCYGWILLKPTVLNKAELIQNPAPDVVLGCLFGGTSQLTWLPYIGSTLYEALLFSLTVYKGMYTCL